MNDSHACFCVGPQNGEPLCPCQMRDVVAVNGRYIKVAEDLGPIRNFEASILYYKNNDNSR